MKDQANAAATVSRAVYASPTLKLYGNVAALTAGGSGTVQESMASMGMGCGPALMKFC